VSAFRYLEFDSVDVQTNLIVLIMGKLEVRKTRLNGVLIVKPITDFVDHRGRYLELYNEVDYHQAGISIKFLQDDVSISKKGVLRGIHGDSLTWKLVTCIFGSIHLIAVNNDKHSEQYKQWQSFLVTEENRVQILIPPKFGNGHLVISEQAIFHYKQSTLYESVKQFTIAWDTPEYGFDWPVVNPTVSTRDLGISNPNKPV